MSRHDSIDILVLDFGVSVQWITKRLQQLNVSFEVVPCNIRIEEIAILEPKGFIMSGSGASVLDLEHPKPDDRLYKMGIPILGICYGFQVMTHQLGGQIIHSEDPEMGVLSSVTVNETCNIIPNSLKEFDGWFIHFDSVHKLPYGFQIVAKSHYNKIVIAYDFNRQFYGTLFHPERTDKAPEAVVILDKFVKEVAIGGAQQRIGEYEDRVKDGYSRAQRHILNLDPFDTETLDLSNFNLERVPSEITRLINLKRLYINENPLKELLPGVGELKQLKTLAIYGGQLTELPEEIGYLQELDYLAVCGNLLKTVPRSIGKLLKVKKLYLDNNLIRALPPEIGQLSSINWIQLNNNLISALPKEIGHLETLRGIRLSYNKLIELPREFGQLTNLMGAQINNNLIEELPEEFCDLPRLQYLQLADNKLKNLPKNFRRLNRLVELILSGNEKLLDDLESRHILNYFKNEVKSMATFRM